MTILVDEKYAEADERQARQMDNVLTQRFIAVHGEEEGRRRVSNMFARRNENILSDGREPYALPD